MMRQLMFGGLIILTLVFLGSGRDALAVGKDAPPGGEDVPVQLVGQWGGSTLAVAIRGAYVVAGMGQRLAVFDITDPGAMQMLGQTDLLPGVVVDIALQGDYAYVASRSGGLQVVDVSQPQHPHTVGAFRMAGDVVRVVIAGPYATILNAQLGLRVLDISDPVHPQGVGAFTDLSQPGQLKIAGDWLYVSTQDTIAVFDRSQATGLRLFVHIPTSFFYINDFEVVGDTLYVVGIDDWAESYLAIYDVSDLHHVRRLSIQTIPGAYGVMIQQSLAYITAGWGGLSVWDISDDSHPVEISNYREDQTGYYRLQIDDAYLIVSLAENGIELFDLAPNGLPTLLGQYRTLGIARAIDSYDSYLYTYLGWHRVAIIDVAEPKHPLVAEIYENEHWSSGAFIIQDALAYVSTSTEGVQIFDLSQPLSPYPSAAVFTPNPYTVFVAPSTLYLWNLTGVHVYDTSSLEKIQLIATILPDSKYGQLFVDNDRLYVTHGLRGLEIYDLSDLADVHLLGTVDTPGDAGNLLVDDGYVFIDDGTDIVIVDANDPRHPFLATTIDPPGDIVAMAYNHPYLYVVSTGFYSDPQGSGGVTAFDVSIPALPRQFAHITLFPSVTDIAVEGNALYLATISSGIAIYQQALVEANHITWLPRLRRP